MPHSPVKTLDFEPISSLAGKSAVSSGPTSGCSGDNDAADRDTSNLPSLPSTPDADVTYRLRFEKLETRYVFKPVVLLVCWMSLLLLHQA